MNKTGCLLSPRRDIAPNAGHALYCLENYLDIRDGDAGLCVVSRDVPLFSAGDQHICRFWSKHQKTPAHLYFNLFNNQWGTNFPQWTEGNFSFEFWLIAHGAPDASLPQQVVRMLKTPRIVRESAEGPCVGLPEGLEVSAFYPLTGGPGFVLRLHNLHAKPRGGVVWVKGLGKVFEADLNGNRQREAPCEAERFYCTVPSFGLKTYLLHINPDGSSGR